MRVRGNCLMMKKSLAGCCFFVVFCIAILCLGRGNSVEICARYPKPDPCLPGGVWDPVIQR